MIHHQPTLNLAQAPASHPHLLITLPESQPASRDHDHYHVVFTLPDAIFVDRHELIDLWGQDKTQNRVQWELTPEKIDIERPISNTTEYSTLRVAWSERVLDVPLHVRYLEPNAVGSEVVPLFQEEGVKAGWNCIDIKGGLKYRGRAEQVDTACLEVFHHRPLVITLPTGRVSDRALVELATPVLIWLGWIYLVTKIWALSKRTRHMKTD
jgi:hypothetical protein